MIHSNFRECINAGVTIQSFCDVNAEYLKNGTLLMPTMTWRTVTERHPFFDVNTTPSHTGAVSEFFRGNLAEYRSLHPTHSVAGLGIEAKNLLADHHLIGTPCSISSPFGKIATSCLLDDAFMVFIDVSLESCTFIHFFEELMAEDIYLVPQDKSEELFISDQFGTRTKYIYRRHTNSPRNFHQFGPELLGRGELKFSHFGQVTVSLVRAKALSSVVKARLHENCMGLLAAHSYR